MNAALQRAPVADQMESEASTLALRTDRWIGQPDLGHEVPAGKFGQHVSVDLVPSLTRQSLPAQQNVGSQQGSLRSCVTAVGNSLGLNAASRRADCQAVITNQLPAAFVEELTTGLRAALGPDLLAVYLLSAVRGGFDAGVSGRDASRPGRAGLSLPTLRSDGPGSRAVATGFQWPEVR